MVRSIFVLNHTHGSSKEEREENQKRLGIYSIFEKAKKASERYVHKVGFKDYPEGFIITERILDEESQIWKNGFNPNQKKGS
ncbi:MAG: hypothetical protein FJX18_07060 [Alphaproteobacteria bacterium]|nr:hypothetical protein [Alphaproteobacteria bacterium]